MLYTKKGDSGTTKTFGCDQRISKSSVIAEALGSLDEINSFLGLCKVKSKESGFYVGKEHPSFESIVHSLQENLFTVQAELAGAPKKVEKRKVEEMEAIIDEIEKELPPIKTFFISGGTELASLFDIARTIARRAERRVTAVKESFFAEATQDKEGGRDISEHTLAYLNRLSSILYALARLSNHKAGFKENAPSYK